MKRLLIGLLLLLLLAACSEASTDESDSAAELEAGRTDAVVADETEPDEAVVDEAVVVLPATSTPLPEVRAEATTVVADVPTDELIAQTIAVTYFTPSQQEGPYYPLEKLADRDNDLVVLDGAAGEPAGTRLDFSGFVYDAAGSPLTGVTIEIWQTDNNGAYMHPNDPATASRDLNFQFYGESVTDELGQYSFRTILPGKYEPRPVHIHVKVRAGEQELLTTQFYFAGDPALAGEGLTGGDNIHMIMAVTEGVDEAGNRLLIGERDIVLTSEQPDYRAALSGANPLLAPEIIGLAAVIALAATYYHPKLVN